MDNGEASFDSKLKLFVMGEEGADLVVASDDDSARSNTHSGAFGLGDKSIGVGPDLEEVGHPLDNLAVDVINDDNGLYI